MLCLVVWQHKSLARQLLRSATSVGANYRAACRAQSRPEFASKLSIVVEEADESLYWLELIQESKRGQIRALDRHHQRGQRTGCYHARLEKDGENSWSLGESKIDNRKSAIARTTERCVMTNLIQDL